MFLAVTVFNTLVKGSALAKIGFTLAQEKAKPAANARLARARHRRTAVPLMGIIERTMLNFLFMQDWSFIQSQPVAKSGRAGSIVTLAVLTPPETYSQTLTSASQSG